MVLPPAARAHQALLGKYLHAGIEVEHSFHGRGVLVGLPCAHINDEQPLATIRLHDRPDSYFPDYYNAADCKPVLYAPEDAMALAHGIPSSQRTSAHHMLSAYDVDSLNRVARMVDTARSMGIALNMPEGSYLRREPIPQNGNPIEK